MSRNLYRKFAKELEEFDNNEGATWNFLDSSKAYYYTTFRLLNSVTELIRESQLRTSQYHIKYWAKAIALLAMSVYFKALEEENELDRKNRKVVQRPQSRKAKEKETTKST